MLALDLQVVISHLHAQLIRGEVLDVQVDRKLVFVRPHLRRHKHSKGQLALSKEPFKHLISGISRSISL